MLFTRNAFYFRKYFKTVVSRDRDLDLNFISPLHPDKSRYEKGFARLIYANRDDVGQFLRTTALNVAADQQAIYELIQNADDCNSTFFSVSYNEDYLLCINNGNYFSESNMSAIINVGASDKDVEEIGTFGIGFKILHRLVGEDDGLNAIIDDYAGPIIFSWNKFIQLDKFISGEEIKVGFDEARDQENAWLVKILYTCFPTSVGEKIRLKDYETQTVKFDEKDLAEMRDFLKISLQNVNLQDNNNLKNGSIFFLKLGKGKFKFIDEGIDNLKSGISYSFNFLNSLKKIYINGEEIRKQNVQAYSKEYKQDSIEFVEIKPRNTKRDIRFSFAFYEDYKRSENIANTKTEKYLPNFYNFFSMDEEKNGFRFLVHCNSFDMNNDRRKLQPNSQINERLLPVIANDIIQFFNRQRERNRELFLSLYASLLLSKEPKNKSNINDFFFSYLKAYLPLFIPTQNGYLDNPQNVKIKNTGLDLNPSDFGCPEIEWFYWQNKADESLIDEAYSSEKLDLDKWNIIKLLEYATEQGKVSNIDEWISTEQPRVFYAFLKEIEKNITKTSLPIISTIKIFKFSDEKFYSINEIFASSDLILNYEKTTEIRFELQAIGFKSSFLNIAEFPNIYDLIRPKFVDLTLFEKIAEKTKNNNFWKDQKHKLFLALVKFENVGPEKLKNLELFKDTQGQIRPLRNLLKGDLQVPNWIFSFKIHIAEYISDLDKYLISEKDIYQSIIYKNWDFIIEQNPHVKHLYEQVTYYYQQNLEENLRLEKLPSVYTNVGFKKPEELFFNILLNNNRFDNLQNAVTKITGKPTPNKVIFSYLIEEKSPFKVSKNENISGLINETVSLDFSEVTALLEFAKQNNEELFKVAYIQKRDEKFEIVKHSQTVFQYYSNRAEINELLSNYSNFRLLPREFNQNDWRNLGIWQDKGLYLKILQNVDFSEKLLPVVKESDKEVQIAYLSKIKTFNLHEGKIYDRNSFEHRCLKLALDCFDASFSTEFAPKILINGTLRIKDIAVKDDINFEGFKTLSLSSVLPKYKGISDIITKIINQFSDFTKTELSEKVFPIGNKKKDEVYNELVTEFKVLQSLQQFAFVLFYSKLNAKKLFSIELLSGLSEKDILNFCYEESFSTINSYVNLGVQNKVYPSEFALEDEKLPSWVLVWLETELSNKQEKVNFLSLLEVHTDNTNLVLLRNFFKTGQGTDIQAKILSFTSNSSMLINTLKWLKNSVFTSNENLKLENLKHIYSRINFAIDIPLLYVQKISTNEITYILDVSTANKYYFELPNKDLEQKIFALLETKGFKLLALEHFKDKQASIGVTEIKTKNQLDLSTLVNNSHEWQDKAYKLWKVTQKHQIFIYSGEKLPYKTTFIEHEICTYTEGTKIKEGDKIFICQSQLHDIRNQLGGFISADELIKLYQFDNDSSSIVQTLQSRISQLEEYIKNLEEGKKAGSWQNNSDTYFDDFGGVVTDREYNLITGYKGEAYIYEELKKSSEFENVIWANQAKNENDSSGKITLLGKEYLINEKGEAYDLTFTDNNGNLCYVQVKATTTSFDRADDVKMIITKREWIFLQKAENKNYYYLARVFGARDNPSMKFLKMEFKRG